MSLKSKKNVNETSKVIAVVVLEMILFLLLLFLSQKYQEYLRLTYSVQQSFFQNNPVAILILIIVIGALSIASLLLLLKSLIDRERLLTDAAMEIRAIMDGIHAGLVNYTMQDGGRIYYASKGFYALLGTEREVLRTTYESKLMPFIYEQYRNLFFDVERLNKKGYIEEEIKVKRADGKEAWFLVTISMAKKSSSLQTFSAVFVDISERKKMREELALEQDRFRTVTEISRDIIVEYEYSTDIIYFSELYRKIYESEPMINGFADKMLKGKSRVHPDDIMLLYDFIQDQSTGKTREVQFRVKNSIGNYVWCDLVGQIMLASDGVTKRLYAKWADIDNMKKEMQELESRAKLDPLTGAFNKSELQSIMEDALQSEPNKNHVFFMLDMDNFKGINDTYGHLNGDKVLIYIVKQINDSLKNNEYFGRFGGDEFALFMKDCKDKESVMEKAKNIYESLQPDFVENDVTVPFSVSIGVAFTEGKTMTLSQLMQKADETLYEVKNSGRNAYKVSESTEKID